MQSKRLRKILSGANMKVTCLAVGLAESGAYSLEAIAEECSREAGQQMSVGQISYRVGLFGLNLREIRNSARGSYIRRKLRKSIVGLTEDVVYEKAERVKYVGTRIPK